MRGELDALISRMHEGGILYSEAVREFRKAFIATVLRENNGNQTKAARELGMHRNTLTAVPYACLMACTRAPTGIAAPYWGMSR